MIHRLLTALFIGLLLAACGDDDPPPPEPVETPAESAAETPEQATDDPIEEARAKIDAEGLLAHIETLASDEFGGREPMTEGERLTLDYLETRFRELGLQPLFGDSYRQPVPLVSIDPGDAAPLAVRLPGGDVHAFEYGPEVMLWTSRMVDSIELDDSELVFVGYGIVAPEYDWNDYEGMDVSGKTVVMLVNDPGFATGDPALFNGRAMTYYGRWTYKYEEAARQGAAGALIIHQAAPASYGWNVVEDSNKGPQFHLASEDQNMGRVKIEGWLQYPVAKDIFALARQDLDRLIERAAEGPVTPVPLGITASTRFTNRLQRAESFNIGAVVPGSERPDELFVYMAHWDHIGTADGGAPGEDLIYNGAEDNASGTAGLLELAEAFMTPGLEPERSVGFLAVT
ncbi:MAG: M28 family metallopeptidase, partial [Xanthomonadales bacterium]|nr:M28 family metallopeptidase [Xanthomonadales bacterium]